MTVSVDALGVLVAQEAVTGGSLPYVEAIVFTLLFVAGLAWLAGRISLDSDRLWLQRFVVWGFLAKVLGSIARYWMVTGVYETGDSLAYHDAGVRLAHVWRGLIVATSDAGGEGTAFTEVITSFLYAFYTPTLLGGFLIFATLAFCGQLLFYAAFRRWFGAEKQKLYAMAVFFFPSLVFWPSSIGKDALMVFFLGIAAYGASRLLHTYKILSSALIIGFGLVLAAGVRPHVAGMFAISMVLAVFLGKAPDAFRGSPKRPVMLIGTVAGAAFVLATFSTTFEVGIESDRTQNDIGGFLEDVSQQTAQGGSQIEGIAISTPSRLPVAVVTVLFRPLILEGTNLQMLASAVEGTALLAVVIWKFPQMWRNKGLLRRKSYMTLCFFYTGGFIIGFSAINNLGILARQRVQLLPIFLALLVGLGWPEETRGPDESDDADSKAPLPVARQPAYSSARREPRVVVAEAAEEDEQLDPLEPAQLSDRPQSDRGTDTATVEVPEKPHPTHRPVRDRIRPQVVELRNSDPGLSIREIARRVGASPATVRRVLVEEDLA